MAYEVNHYIPQFILKNFCNTDEKTINLLDILNFKVEKRNVDRSFYKKNFYDINPSVSEDPKVLEKMFGTLIESKLAPIIKKISLDQENFTLTRDELELFKNTLQFNDIATQVINPIIRKIIKETFYRNTPKNLAKRRTIFGNEK
jgi:hypothetical protein